MDVKKAKYELKVIKVFTQSEVIYKNGIRRVHPTYVRPIIKQDYHQTLPPIFVNEVTNNKFLINKIKKNEDYYDVFGIERQSPTSDPLIAFNASVKQTTTLTDRYAETIESVINHGLTVGQSDDDYSNNSEGIDVDDSADESHESPNGNPNEPSSESITVITEGYAETIESVINQGLTVEPSDDDYSNENVDDIDDSLNDNQFMAINYRLKLDKYFQSLYSNPNETLSDSMTDIVKRYEETIESVIKQSLAVDISNDINCNTHTLSPTDPNVISNQTLNDRTIYPSTKDSFSRFGDDLSQLLLSYLSFEDKFKYECICKQWKSLVFSKQNEMIFDNHFKHKRIKWKSFESIFKKCPNITRIEFKNYDFPINNSILDSIIRNCRHLRDIRFEYNYRLELPTIDRFFQKFAKQLKTIRFDLYEEPMFKSNKRLKKLMNCIDKNIILCTNVSSVDVYFNAHRYWFSYNKCFPLPRTPDDNQMAFKKLTKLSFRFSDNNVSSIEVLAINYTKQMKSIDVTIDKLCNRQSFIILTNVLTRMEELIDLRITYYNHYDDYIDTNHSVDSENDDPSDLDFDVHETNLMVNNKKKRLISDLVPIHLRDIGVNCRKLKRLALRLSVYQINLMQTIWISLNANYKQLKRLEIVGNNSFDFWGQNFGFKFLTQLKQLTHLTLIFYGYFIRVYDIDTIDINFPQLQHLTLQIKQSYLPIDGYYVQVFGKDIWDELSRLRRLHTITLYGESDEINQQFIDYQKQINDKLNDKTFTEVYTKFRKLKNIKYYGQRYDYANDWY